MPDWAQKLIASLGMTVVYALGSVFYLAFLNPKGELVQYRVRMIGYGSGFMMVFMCSLFFNTGLRQAWRSWLAVFIAVTIGILVWGAAAGGRNRAETFAEAQTTGGTQDPRVSAGPRSPKRPWRTWQKIGVVWIVMNLIPLWILGMIHRARTP